MSKEPTAETATEHPTEHPADPRAASPPPPMAASSVDRESDSSEPKLHFPPGESDSSGPKLHFPPGEGPPGGPPPDFGIEFGGRPIPPQPIPKLRLLAITTGVALGLFLSMIDSSIVATSLFTIAVEFKDVGSINWVALAYTLSFLSCASLFARISDVVGRRVAFATAYVIFIAFSLASGFAKSMNQLIAFRALQGLGGSGLYSISMIIMPEVTPDHAKKYISAVVGTVLASAGVLGPVLGGVLTQYASWRWVFWINGPVGGVSLVVFLLTWPNKKYLPSLERRRWRDVDYFGAFLLIASAVLIVFPFQNAAKTPTWGSAIFLAPLLTGLATLTGLFAWQLFLERRGINLASAVPLVLIRNRAYAGAVLHTMLLGFPYLVCIYTFPVRFQVVYGKSARDAGLMLLPMLAATAIGTVLAGIIAGSPGKKARFFETMMGACVMMMLGCGLEIMAGSDGKVEAKVLGFLAFIGLGFGLSASGGTMVAAVEPPVFEHASAQGIMAQIRIFGGSIGIAASSAILGSKSRAQLATGDLPAEALAQLASNPAALSPSDWVAIRRVYTDALKEDMIVCCAVLAVAMVVTLAVYRKNRIPMEDMIKQRYVEEGERRRSQAISQMEAARSAAASRMEGARSAAGSRLEGARSAAGSRLDGPRSESRMDGPRSESRLDAPRSESRMEAERNAARLRLEGGATPDVGKA